MEGKTWVREKNQTSTTESRLLTRNSKVTHKRKSKALLREWQTTDDQFNEKGPLGIVDGIEEYKSNNQSEYCSKVYVVIPTDNLSITQETSAKVESEKALINKSEYDISKPDSTIFSRDSIGRYLYEVQSKTGLRKKDKSTATTESGKIAGRFGSLQKHVFKQTYRQSSIVAMKTLESDTIIPREESFVSQTSASKPRSKPRSGGKYKRQNHNCSPITCSQSNFNEQVSCPSHVYSFDRGLVPSREAHSLELFHTEHFLPPVVADRIGNISEQKNYRLSLEKGAKSSNSANYILNTLYCNDQDGRCLKQKKEPTSVVYKEFSAETIIPAAYGKRRYFDFQGYIEFLCKERNLRKTSAMTARQLDDYDWERLESSSWLNNLGKVLVKDVYDYNRILDIKGSRMRLDENPVQMRFQTKPLPEPHRHCCLGHSNNLKPQTQLAQLRGRKTKQKAVLVERLPSKFQFTLPGRPPSSDDSGFAE